MSDLVHLHFDITDLVSKASALAQSKADLQRAIRQGLSEGGNKVRTDVRRALWRVTGAKNYKTVTTRTNGMLAEGGSGAEYRIIASPKRTGIDEFRVALRHGAGGGVVGAPWGVSRQFARSFGLHGDDVKGFRVRTTNKRFPIHKLYGPNIAKEMMQPAITTVFVLSVQAQVEPVIIKRISRALGVA